MATVVPERNVNESVPSGRLESSIETTQDGYGCEHYRRKCQFVTPCCQKLYTCRFCHNEKENHELNRPDVTEVQCLRCHTRQGIREVCLKCNLKFGQYYCEKCKLFDDEDKKQYHCDGCGICRIGGRDNFFHCNKCDMCLPRKKQEGHKCIENVSHNNCPVCLEDIHTSRIPSHVLPCAHLIHKNCVIDMLNSGNYKCPLCLSSMINMKEVWLTMDREVAETPLPPMFKNRTVWVLCRECHKESEVNFHFVGLKCGHCGGYNTCEINAPPPSQSKTGDLLISDSVVETYIESVPSSLEVEEESADDSDSDSFLSVFSALPSEIYTEAETSNDSDSNRFMELDVSMDIEEASMDNDSGTFMELNRADNDYRSRHLSSRFSSLDTELGQLEVAD